METESDQNKETAVIGALGMHSRSSRKVAQFARLLALDASTIAIKDRNVPRKWVVPAEKLLISATASLGPTRKEKEKLVDFSKHFFYC